MKDERDPYIIEVDNGGCDRCQSGRTWTIVGPDDIAASQSWFVEADAQELADMLNDAFRKGRALSAASHPQEAALAQPGRKLVPVEPTPEMRLAASSVCIGFSGDYSEHNDYLSDDAAREVWEAMLAAAQPDN